MTWRKSKDIVWICELCALQNGGHPRDLVSTWHNGTCDVCGDQVDVTEPRDFCLSRNKSMFSRPVPPPKG